MSDPIGDIRALFAPFLAEAEGALARREEQYPGLVAAGRMDQQTSARETDIWRAIVADWRNVVTGNGPKGSQATAEEKIAVLKESVDRYGAALIKSIANQSDSIRQDCATIKDRALLADLQGKAVARYLELLESRDRMIDIIMVYYSTLPMGRPWRGIWRDIDQYLDFHHSARADRQQRRAA